MKARLARLIEDVTVKSLANGNMLVEVKYLGDYADGEPHGPGVFTRLAIAMDMQHDLRNKLARAKRAM